MIGNLDFLTAAFKGRRLTLRHVSHPRVVGAFCAALASTIATTALAHGEGLQSGAHWICPLETPLYNHSGNAQIILLDEEGIGAPSIVVSFQDGTDLPHILNANWDEGLTFSQAAPSGAQFTLIQNPYNAANYALTIWHPSTNQTDTLASCKGT